MTSLKKQAASGVKWTALSTSITTGLQFLKFAILARILGPEAFGLMGMVMVVIGFAQAFADMGVSNAIIYRQDATKEQLSSLYWLNILSGIVVFFIIWAVTPLVVVFYKEPQLNSLLHWTALIFLITPIGQQFQILLQRELKFNWLSVIEVITALADIIVAVLFAWRGSGVMALVLGQLAHAICRAVCLSMQGWRTWAPKFHFSLDDVKGYVGFGLYQMGERTINYFNSNLDYLLIGRLLGAEPLGYYTLAYNLIIAPVVKINPIITRVAFPVFAKVQNDQQLLKRGYLTVMRALSFVNFPIFFGLFATSSLLVHVVFGPKWLPSIILIKILCGVGLLRSTGNPVGSLLLAKGRADWGFMWNLMLMTTQVPGVIIGVHHGGVVGVAVAYLILQMIYFILNYLVLIRRLLGQCILEYLGSMWHALKYSAIMGLGVLAVSKFLMNLTANLSLSMQIISGVVIYALLWLLFRREDIVEFKDLLFGR